MSTILLSVLKTFAKHIYSQSLDTAAFFFYKADATEIQVMQLLRFLPKYERDTENFCEL